jgi:uncharacterized membrane protein
MSKLLTKTEEDKLVAAIAEAEASTSGEIRVHIEKKCDGDAVQRAIEVFEQLGMSKTEKKNGVLFYLASDSKKFAVIGDDGINKIVGKQFWNSTKEILHKHFVKGEFYTGLELSIAEIGKQLKSHFPYHKDDTNELPNDISFG